MQLLTSFQAFILIRHGQKPRVPLAEHVLVRRCVAQTVGFALPVKSVIVLTEVTEDASFPGVCDYLSQFDRGPDLNSNNCMCTR